MSGREESELANGSVHPATKSLADVLLAVLADRPKKLWKLFLLIALVAILLGGILLGLVAFVFYRLPPSASEIKLGPASVLFSQSEKGEDKYVLVVPPEGWTKTSIKVPEGASLEIEAGGRVHIDLGGLNDALRVRHEYEDRIQRYKDAGKLGNVSDEDFAPDDYFKEPYFNEEELKAMRPTWMWIGPDGASKEEMKTARPARKRRSILPDEGYGALLASFDSKDVEPSAGSSVVTRLVSGAFLVGRHFPRTTMPADRSGYLYFSVNDVQSKNPDFPDMFFIDNIGAFIAKVTVKTK